MDGLEGILLLLFQQQQQQQHSIQCVLSLFRQLELNAETTSLADITSVGSQLVQRRKY